MELYELIIEDENIDEVYALSLVENPAIEANWVYFTEHKEQVKFATVDNDKRTIVAPVLIPDKRIYRVDERTGKEYEVFIRAETIEKLAQQYLMKGYQNKATVEHSENIDGDITVVESWVSKSSTKDKSANYFTRIFPAGTWFVTLKVNDEKLWQDYVKTGKVKAISIEGLFGHQLVKAAAVLELMEKDINDLTEDEALVVLSKIRTMFESYSDYGEGIRNNAKKGIELNEKNGNKCATQTGKVRAQQIANGEKLSIDTIKRMYSYLSRAETYYDNAESENDCGNISYLLWGGKEALSYSRNKLRELGLLEEAEAQPTSDGSTYPGQAASGSIAPALLGDVPPVLQDFAECPAATQNIALNLYNRSIAIKQANYGPLNPNEPNEEYWENKAKEFGGSIEEAKTALCGNCAFFDVRKETLNCIAEGIGYEDDPEKVIEAGELGYCEAFDFKCAAKRTCSAWVVGGPIKMAEVGPRGGIRESPKAPKSDTPNRNPKGEGTAKGDASGKRGAEVSAKDEETLKNKVKDFNERDSNTKNGKATLGVLKSVFQRGLGAYTGGHSPRVQSASQWAFARVNAFLYLLKNGRPQNPKYVNDNDLLPKGHPKANK